MKPKLLSPSPLLLPPAPVCPGCQGRQGRFNERKVWEVCQQCRGKGRKKGL